MHNRTLLPLVVITVCLVASEATARSYKGKAFPDFTATDAITGDKFSLSDLRGKVVLVDFWATWCGPCVKELPNVTRAYSQYHKQGFEIVSISLDSDRRRFKTFVRSKRMNWYHVMEGGGWKTRLAGKYGVNSIPRMYVLDPAGVCIAENVRGRQLDSVIKRGLEMVDNAKAPPKRAPAREPRRPKRRADRPPSPTKPIELVAARAQLAAAAAPLEELDRRLESLETELAAVEQQLPAPRDPDATRRRFELALKGLADARHTAFLMGLLDGRQAPAVPGNPLETAPGDERSWAQLDPTLQAARDSIVELRDAVGDVTDRLSDIKAEIRELERESALGPAAEGRVDEIEARIADVAGDLDGPWAGQVETARRIVADAAVAALRTQVAQRRERFDGLIERVAALQQELDDRLDAGDSADDLRERFSELAREVLALHDRANS